MSLGDISRILLDALHNTELSISNKRKQYEKFKQHFNHTDLKKYRDIQLLEALQAIHRYIHKKNYSTDPVDIIPNSFDNAWRLIEIELEVFLKKDSSTNRTPDIDNSSSSLLRAILNHPVVYQVIDGVLARISKIQLVKDSKQNTPDI